VIALYLKNLALFGVPAATSWTGMNLWRVVGDAVPKEDVSALIEQGKIPSVAGIKLFSLLPKYPEEYAYVPVRYRHIRMLSEPRKEGTWVKNMNHYGYIAVSRDYGRAARYVIRHRPDSYLSGVRKAWGIYLQPSWDFKFVGRNIRPARACISVFTAFQAGPLRGRTWLTGEARQRCRALSVWVLVPCMLLVTVLAVSTLMRARRRDGRGDPAFVFMVITIVYVAVVGNCFELGENNRFRVMTDPLLFVATVLAVRRSATMIAGAIRSRRRSEV
jgi:hypothetical protein